MPQHPFDPFAGPGEPGGAGAPPQAAQSGGAALLDDPLEWPAFGRPLAGAATPSPSPASAPGAVPPQPGAQPAPGLWESHVVLQGMHCAACALTIEDALRRVPGVVAADVSAATQRARVVWNPASVLPSGWIAAVQGAGYGALPALDAFTREHRDREQRRALWRWLVAGFCMMQVMMYAWPAYQAMPGDLSPEMERLLRWASWVISLPVMLFACGPFFSSAWRDVRQRRIGMDLPVALGMAITFAVSTAGTFDPAGLFGREVYFDSLTMFVFFLLTGRWLELRLRGRTAGALEAVMNRLPASVECLGANGRFTRVATRRLAVGDTVRVLPGEAFPGDGRITRGGTQADEALLTGESTPVARPLGSTVAAGSYNLQATVEVRIDGLGGDTRFGQIVALMESASLQKPRLAQLADRIARPFLVAVLLAAGLAAAWWWPAGPAHALMVAVAVLIVTCPCALSLATPVALLTASGTLARHGVLVRRLQALEALAGVDTVAFDKTGTLTQGGLGLGGVEPAPDSGLTADQSLSLAATLARHSLHPASRAIVLAAGPWEAGAPGARLADVQELPGSGLQAREADGALLRLGSPSHAGVPMEEGTGSVTVLSRQRVLAGGTLSPPQCLARFTLAETLRPEAAEVVATLRRAGVRVLLLSGDRDAAVRRVARSAGIDEAWGDCTPADKLQRLQALQAQGRSVAMVGDGLNDGPVLAGAQVSFAFGRAVPLARARSDFVVPGEHLGQVAQTLLLARRTTAVVRQNLAWAAGYNALCVPLAVAGWMPAWLAGLGMAASSLLVVLNAARLARWSGDAPPSAVGARGPVRQRSAALPACEGT